MSIVKNNLKEGDFFILRQKTLFHSHQKKLLPGEIFMFMSFSTLYVEKEETIVTHLNAVHPVLGTCYAEFVESRENEQVDLYIECLNHA